MAYDRADWHYSGEYPEDLGEEHASTHVGMFLTWIIFNHLEGEYHQKYSQNSLLEVRKKLLTGKEFFISECSCKFWEEDLNEEGNAFAKYYYQSGIYFSDYENILAKGLETLYHVEDTWDNYEKMEKVITDCYEEWKK